MRALSTSMPTVIDGQRTELAALCSTHRVRRLELFGSAADGTFDPSRSDLDFLVEYQVLSPHEHYDAYFGLWEGLEALFDRKVDLIEPHTIKNPYVLKEVNDQRVIVYEA